MVVVVVVVVTLLLLSLLFLLLVVVVVVVAVAVVVVFVVGFQLRARYYENVVAAKTTFLSSYDAHAIPHPQWVKCL